MCSISAAKMEGGLRSNWQHPCFQCNCTYLASHLRGSFRGSGLIEQSIVKWRGARSRDTDSWAITPVATFSEAGTSAHAGHFQSVCFNRSSSVTNKCSCQFSFYRNLTDHYFTASLPAAHSNGSGRPL